MAKQNPNAHPSKGNMNNQFGNNMGGNDMEYYEDDEEAQKAIEEKKRAREVYVKERVQKL